MTGQLTSVKAKQWYLLKKPTLEVFTNLNNQKNYLSETSD